MAKKQKLVYGYRFPATIQRTRASSVTWHDSGTTCFFRKANVRANCSRCKHPASAPLVAQGDFWQRPDFASRPWHLRCRKCARAFLRYARPLVPVCLAGFLYSQQLYTLPLSHTAQTIKSEPHSTEDQKIRITIPRRVEGEYVNYKEFETGDNIQRIVWKIYAKSGELVVRIPEIKDPYASHLYFYASFFHGFEHERTALLKLNSLMSTSYDHVRNLFEAIQRNGYDVRLPQDQEVPKLAGLGDKKKGDRSVSNHGRIVAKQKMRLLCLY